MCILLTSLANSLKIKWKKNLVFEGIFPPLSLELLQQERQQSLQFRQDFAWEELLDFIFVYVLVNASPNQHPKANQKLNRERISTKKAPIFVEENVYGDRDKSLITDRVEIGVVL